MAEMQLFALWWLEELPAFLMSEPICYFIGFAFLIVVVRIIREIIHIT